MVVEKNSGGNEPLNRCWQRLMARYATEGNAMPSISALRIAARFAPLPHAAAFEAKKPILKPFEATLPWDDTQRGKNTMLSLSEAATKAGIAKSTIWRAVKSGRISATKTDTGGFRIDPAELFRVFPPATSSATEMTQDATAVERAAMAALETQITALKDVNVLLREQLDDTKKDRDAWRQQAESNQRLLADARPRRGLFGWGAKR